MQVVIQKTTNDPPSLETQELDHHLSAGTESYAEALSYFPDEEIYHLGPDEYLEHIRKAKAAHRRS